MGFEKVRGGRISTKFRPGTGREARPRGPPRQNSANLRRLGGPGPPQHKVPQNYAPKEGPRASKGPPQHEIPRTYVLRIILDVSSCK